MAEGAEKLEGGKREVLVERLVGWKLFYADGKVFTSRDCAFEDAPQRGIVVLIKYHARKNQPPFREIQSGKDFYVLYPFDALDVEVPKKVKVGGYIHTGIFRKILSAAEGDEEFVEEIK